MTNNHLSISKSQQSEDPDSLGIPIHRESIIIWHSPLYICRELSTNQPFLCKTNPILSAVGGLQMNLNFYSTMAYENKSNRTLGQNKPNSNPIKANLRKAKMNVNLTLTKDYRKKDDFAVRINKPNSNPISVKPKMSANVYVIEDYENETAQRPKKTNPIKPNFRKAKMNLKTLAKKSGHTRLTGLWATYLTNYQFFYRMFIDETI